MDDLGPGRTPEPLDAEGVGFEPTVTRGATTAFEAAPFVRSGNPPLTSVVG